MNYDNERTRDQPDYLAYLVRLWRVSAGGATTWRASLECPHTGEQIGFSGVRDLFDFLSEKTGSGKCTPADVSTFPGPSQDERVPVVEADKAEKGGEE
jgi:hypothetical protein